MLGLQSYQAALLLVSEAVWGELATSAPACCVHHMWGFSRDRDDPSRLSSTATGSQEWATKVSSKGPEVDRIQEMYPRIQHHGT